MRRHKTFVTMVCMLCYPVWPPAILVPTTLHWQFLLLVSTYFCFFLPTRSICRHTIVYFNFLHVFENHLRDFLCFQKKRLNCPEMSHFWESYMYCIQYKIHIYKKIDRSYDFCNWKPEAINLTLIRTTEKHLTFLVSGLTNQRGGDIVNKKQ